MKYVINIVNYFLKVKEFVSGCDNFYNVSNMG